MDIEEHLAALRATSCWQTLAIWAPRDVATDISGEKENKEELRISQKEYIPASLTVLADTEDEQRMNEAAFKVHKETKEQRFTDDF